MLDRFERRLNSISGWLYWVSCAAIVAMMLLTTVDLIGLKFFRWHFAGALEITQLLGLMIVGFAISFTLVLRGHTVVDFLVNRLRNRARAVVASITSLFGLVLFALVAWQMYDFGRDLQAAGRVTALEQIPLAPFAYATAACSLVMCLLLLVALLRMVKGVVGK